MAVTPFANSMGTKMGKKTTIVLTAISLALLALNTVAKENSMSTSALEHYTQSTLKGDLWKRPELSQRDRSIITVAVLVARNQSAELPPYLNRAIDSGVKPD